MTDARVTIQTKKFEDLSTDRAADFMEKTMKDHPDMNFLMTIALLLAWKQGWEACMKEATTYGVEKTA